MTVSTLIDSIMAHRAFCMRTCQNERQVSNRVMQTQREGMLQLRKPYYQALRLFVGKTVHGKRQCIASIHIPAQQPTSLAKRQTRFHPTRIGQQVTDKQKNPSVVLASDEA